MYTNFARSCCCTATTASSRRSRNVSIIVWKMETSDSLVCPICSLRGLWPRVSAIIASKSIFVPSCRGCNMIETCDACDEAFCNGCSPMFTCDHCESTNCVDCTPFSICSRWNNTTSCEECYEVWTCVECEEEFCRNCESPTYFDCCERVYCDGCKSSHTGTGGVDVALLEAMISRTRRSWRRQRVANMQVYSIKWTLCNDAPGLYNTRHTVFAW